MYHSKPLKTTGGKQKSYAITAKEIYTKNKGYNLSLVKQMLSEGHLIEFREMIHIVREFQSHLHNEANVVKVNDPVIIVGDIHGQYLDLVKIMALFSEEKLESSKHLEDHKETTFIFLGDYVDRGIMAIEVISLLMILKLSSPKNCVMLRGNHESRIMTELYNFKRECIEKYSQEIFEIFMDCFDCLPIACVVNDKYFCVHGGISDKLKTISEINKIERIEEIPLSGAFCDYIWSDPTPIESGKLKVRSEFNESRECSIYYGAELAGEFLKENKLHTIIRGHEVFQEGYKFYNWLKRERPMAITVFSAPNYCNTYGNKGAVMRIEVNLYHYEQPENDLVRIRQYKQEMIENYKFIETPDVFKFTGDKMIETANKFSNCMINRICELYIPELVDEPPERQLQSFLMYFKERSKGKEEEPKKSKFSILNMEKEENNKTFKTEEEEKNFLFSRSREYFRDSDKIPPNAVIPKQNRFSSGNGRLHNE